MKSEPDAPIRVTALIVDEVGEPRNDGTPGAALYSVPFQLSRKPSPTWVRFFLETWDLPPRFTSMHRPGIASIVGDRIVLNGTTIEEVQKYHLETLKLAVSEANRLEQEEESRSQERAKADKQRREQHRRHVASVASGLKFDAP